MTNDRRQMTEDGTQVQSDEKSVEKNLEAYPLRTPFEDPRWAVRIVWVWVSIAIFLILFIVTLMILGIWYD